MKAFSRARRAFLGRLATLGSAAVLALGQTWSVHAAALIDHLTRIQGRVIRRGDADYRLWWASMVWYLFKPPRYPDLIVRARSEGDVVAAIAHARDQGLKIVARSSGHNPARAVLRDGGLLLDLSLLRDVEIDAPARTAWIGPGARSEEFIEQTRRHDLAFPAAHTGIVGLGGYLLGGGLGWSMPYWGIACRSVLAAEVIMADGKKRMASADENPDLLWALRGAGPGFFGAVLRYQLQLHPCPREIRKSRYLVPIEKLPELTAFLTVLAAQKDERVEILAVIGRWAPDDVPPAVRPLAIAVSVIAFGDSNADTARLLDPVAASGIGEISTLKKEAVAQSFSELYAGQITDHSSPHRSAVENLWTDAPGEALATLAALMQASPPASPRSFVLSAWGFNPMKPDDDMSFTNSAAHYVSWYLIAEKAADLEPNQAWMDTAVDRLRPLTRGRYINEIDPRRYPRHVAECFSAEKWARLRALRREHDPTGLFHDYLGHDA